MKILKIEFCNINSLAGNWCIDFESPDFAQTGMFCILGPTGSGKTSILDAICLAFYGKTPRQDKVNSSKNEIMTYNTTKCWSKVYFESRGVRYSACWSQEHTKNGKSLKAYEWVLTNEATGSPEGSFSDQREIEKKMTEVIGLNFTQFSRSMMLAQGEFNTFLKCKDTERAEILEKLSGDSIYRDIAKAVYKLYTNADKAVKEIRQKMGDTTPLSEEDLKQLTEGIQAKKTEKDSVKKQIKQFDEICQWFGTLHGLEKDLQSAQQNLDNCSDRKKEFAADKERLDKAHRAQKVEPSYTEFNTERNNLKEAHKKLVEKTGLLDNAKDALEKATGDYNKANAEFAKCKADYQNAESIWDKVSGLDENIKNAKSNLKDAQDAVTKANGDVLKTNGDIQTLQSDIKSSEEQLAAAEEYIAKHADDADIESHLPLIKSKVDEWRETSSAYETATKNLSKANAELQEFDSAQKSNQANFSKLQEYLKSNKQDEQLAEILPELRSCLEKATGHKSTSTSLQQKIDEARPKLESKKAHVGECDKKIEKLKQEKESIVQSDIPVVVAELRGRLHEGTECPVCGSKEHPACSHGSAEVEAKADALSNFADKLRRIDKEIGNIQTDKVTSEGICASLESEIQDNTEKKNAEDSNFQKAIDSINEKIRPWGISTTPETAASDIERLNERKSMYTQKYTEASSLEKDLSKSAIERTNLLNAQKSAQNELNNATERRNTLAAEIEGKISKWISNVRMSDIDALLLELSNRKQKWTEVQNSKQEQTGMRNTGKSNLQLLQTHLTDAKANQSSAVSKQTECENELHRLDQERHQIFGDKNVDDERRAAASKRDDADTKAQKAKDEEQKKLTQKTALESEVQNLNDTIKQKSPVVEQLQSAFDDNLDKNGFSDEPAFLTARLDNQECEELEKRDHKIENDIVAATTTLDDTKNRHKQHVDKRNFEESEENAIQKLQQANALSDKLTDEFNEMVRQKENDDECRKKSAVLQQELEVAQEKLDNWHQMQSWFVQGGKLDDGTGNFFAKFVQIITLRNLLAIANEHLHQMYPRYELCAKPDSLDILLLDHDNCDAIRSVSNISGGESFLVSLSLALGIATLASRNVSIDSMFLDEGFGTLDNHILQDTIGVLQKLQQEKGKLLGVITHVAMIREEIPVQVNVTPRGRGRSVLHGAGVKQSAA